MLCIKLNSIFLCPYLYYSTETSIDNVLTSWYYFLKTVICNTLFVHTNIFKHHILKPLSTNWTTSSITCLLNGISQQFKLNHPLSSWFWFLGKYFLYIGLKVFIMLFKNKLLIFLFTNTVVCFQFDRNITVLIIIIIISFYYKISDLHTNSVK